MISTTWSGEGREWSVNYEREKWTYPHARLPGSKLFVFEDKASAKQFLNNFATGDQNRHKYKIFECEVQNPRKLTVCARLSQIRKIWSLRRKKKRFSDLNMTEWLIPKGTVHADAVKLVAEVT